MSKDPYKAKSDRDALEAIARFSHDEFSVEIAKKRLAEPDQLATIREAIRRIEKQLEDIRTVVHGIK